MSWSSDSDPSDGGWSPDSEGDGDARPEVMLFTNIAFRLRLTPVAHERAGPGEQAFATYLADAEGAPDAVRPVAVGMLPAETVAALVGSDLFAEPAPLMLRAGEAEGGQLRAVISALLPRPALERFARRLEREAEPWSASVPDEAESIPGVDDAAGGGEGNEALVPFALGVLFRFPENRKHPDDMPAEAADLFMTVLRGGAMDADAKKIDNLISGL